MINSLGGYSAKKIHRHHARFCPSATGSWSYVTRITQTNVSFTARLWRHEIVGQRKNVHLLPIHPRPTRQTGGEKTAWVWGSCVQQRTLKDTACRNPPPGSLVDDTRWTLSHRTNITLRVVFLLEEVCLWKRNLVASGQQRISRYNCSKTYHP